MRRAVEFINEVKEQASDDVYQQFISTLKNHELTLISMEQMNQTIKELLKPYPILLRQFQIFMPQEQAVT